MVLMVVIKKFGSEWCGPCQKQEPILESVEEDNQDVSVERIDVEENGAVANEYNIRSLPTIVIEDANGDIVGEFIGVTQQDEIESSLP